MAEDPNSPDQNHNPPPEPAQNAEPPIPGLPPDIVPSIDLREPEGTVWSGWDVLLIALLALAVIFVFGVIGFSVAEHMRAFRGLSVAQLSRNPILVIPVQAAAYLVVLGCMQWVVRHRYRGPFWRAIHWHFPGSNAYLPFAGGIVLAVAIQVLSTRLPIPKQLPIEKFFSSTAGTYLMAIFGITLAPLMEELFFRGFLYPTLARWAGTGFGIAVTSFLFALIHQSQLGHAWAPILLLFLVGLVLTSVRAYTGSVARSFLIHVGYNCTLFFLLWLQTDRFHHLEKAACFVFTLKP
jgi:CAAX protease family protein